MRASRTGLIACSRRSASSWTSSQGMPRTSVRKRSMSRWRRTTPSAWSRPLGGEADRLVAAAGDVAVALEPADHLVDRRRGELHRARDVRAGHRELGLLQPEQRLQVLLLGDGGLVGCHGVTMVPARRASLGSPGLASRERADRSRHPRGRDRRLARDRARDRAGARGARRDRRARRPLGHRPAGAGRAAARIAPRARLRRGPAARRSRRPIEDFVTAAGGLDLVVANAGIAHYEPIASRASRRSRT